MITCFEGNVCGYSEVSCEVAVNTNPLQTEVFNGRTSKKLILIYKIRMSSLSMVPTNTELFLHGLQLCGKSRF